MKFVNKFTAICCNVSHYSSIAPEAEMAETQADISLMNRQKILL